MSKQETTSTQSLPVDDVEPNTSQYQTDSENAVDGSAQAYGSDMTSDPASVTNASDAGASDTHSPNTNTAAEAAKKAGKILGMSKHVFAGLVAVVAVAAAVGAGVFFAGNPSVDSAQQTQEKLGVDPNAGEYQEAEPQEASSGIAIPGWQKIELPANQTEVTVNFNNPDANADQYYLSFELRLKDTGEVLYTSALVPPGKTIQNITLSRPLEAGEYEAVIHVQPYKMDENQTKTNNADMETVLVVK